MSSNRSDNNRKVVIDILLDMEQQRTFLGDALDKALRKMQFADKKDRSFITREAEGISEYLLSLDKIIGGFSKTPVKKLRPIIRNILRLGIYEMLFMDSVPSRATINECVNMTKAHNMMKLSGFVNAVLRSVDRKLTEEDYYKVESTQESNENTTRDAMISSELLVEKELIRLERIAKVFGFKTLSEKYSAPEWLVSKLSSIYGEEKTEKILSASFTRKKLTIRYNRTLTTKEELRDKLTEKGIAVSDGKYSDSALQISDIDFVRRLPGYKEGLFSVQAESSMRAVEALEIKEGMKVIDLCAAPGGKSLYTAELQGGTGEVVSRDISDDKIEKICDNMTRLRLANMKVEKADATVFDEKLSGSFDIVIADVPCSGLGVMGRKSDIKYRLKPEDIASLSELSRSILTNAVRYVKPGGKLLFSTCTILPEENEENARWLLDEFKGDMSIEAQNHFVQGLDDTDGFYYSIFRKND